MALSGLLLQRRPRIPPHLVYSLVQSLIHFRLQTTSQKSQATKAQPCLSPVSLAQPLFPEAPLVQFQSRALSRRGLQPLVQGHNIVYLESQERGSPFSGPS